MKKKFIIINVLLSLAVLFSILFQLIHSYEHHFEQLEAKHYIDYQCENKTKITQDHNVHEKCFTCDFSFSLFTETNVCFFQFHKNNALIHIPLFSFQEHSSFFKGCLFLLRAPPLF